MWPFATQLVQFSSKTLQKLFGVWYNGITRDFNGSVCADVRQTECSHVLKKPCAREAFRLSIPFLMRARVRPMNVLPLSVTGQSSKFDLSLLFQRCVPDA